MEELTALGRFQVTKVRQSRISEVDFNHLGFGKVFSDHMLEVDFKDGRWLEPRLHPFQPLTLSPANAALHYGQTIFEGIKAYRDLKGHPQIFRPHENFLRFNLSADRMAMPGIPEEIFLEGMKQLVSLDRNWIPSAPGCSLYIRPLLFATDEVIGVKPSERYKFLILTSPAGPYFNKPIKLFIQDKYVRAFPGGVGYAKTAGNYAASLKPTQEVRELGYDQILWTDGMEHRYLQECGTMNLFAILGNTAVTPDLEQGTILAGVTRSSVISLLEEQGLSVEERPLAIEEILDGHRDGNLKEFFGTGTAAGVASVEQLAYRDLVLSLDYRNWIIAPRVLRDLEDIKLGRVPDRFGWNTPV